MCQVQLNPEQQQETIETGTLNLEGQNIDYEIKQGLNLELTNQCDLQWIQFYTEVFNHIKDAEQEVRDRAISAMQDQGVHWRWFRKALDYNKEEYKWFFLIAQEQVQAVCITYQPKDSVLEPGQIFYIDYIAVAPWNRNNEFQPRRFSGLGMTMIKTLTNYAIKNLSLKPGFSLHSLPSAESWYLQLGMKHISKLDKGPDEGSLKFFEITSSALATKGIMS
jgi:hypothetical protein